MYPFPNESIDGVLPFLVHDKATEKDNDNPAYRSSIIQATILPNCSSGLFFTVLHYILGLNAMVRDSCFCSPRPHLLTIRGSQLQVQHHEDKNRVITPRVII